MATVNLSATHDHTPHTEALADRVFATSAMVGAGCGALAGVNLTGGLLGGYAPAVFGTFGVIAGSMTTAFVGRYLLFPAWAALSRAIPHRNV